ncbi:hypothetical protein FB451DRAFT_1387658 [Mycena latifolia]|nr:hypothetical protein FB451DRAFT_1387658 [Mycena latifolia]
MSTLMGGRNRVPQPSLNAIVLSKSASKLAQPERNYKLAQPESNRAPEQHELDGQAGLHRRMSTSRTLV